MKSQTITMVVAALLFAGAASAFFFSYIQTTDDLGSDPASFASETLGAGGSPRSYSQGDLSDRAVPVVQGEEFSFTIQFIVSVFGNGSSVVSSPSWLDINISPLIGRVTMVGTVPNTFTDDFVVIDFVTSFTHTIFTLDLISVPSGTIINDIELGTGNNTVNLVHGLYNYIRIDTAAYGLNNAFFNVSELPPDWHAVAYLPVVGQSGVITFFGPTPSSSQTVSYTSLSSVRYLTLNVPSALSITSSSTPSDAVAGQFWSHVITTNYSDTQISVSGLPSWLQFNGSNIVMGSYPPGISSPVAMSFTVTVTRGFETVNQTVSFNVNPAPVSGLSPFADFVTQSVPGGLLFVFSGLYADSLEWDFGDGTVSTEWSPVHDFSRSGTFTVTLTASNSYGYDVVSYDITVGDPGHWYDGLVQYAAIAVIAVIVIGAFVAITDAPGRGRRRRGGRR